MESVLGRYRNLIILVGVLFLQVLGLAMQVKRSGGNDAEDTRLIRIWAVGAITPFERILVWVQNGTGNIWHNYFYLRGVRAENRQLKDQIEQMRLEQVRLSEDAAQARRLQTLLAFKEQFISRTVAAQVIGSSGSDLSRIIYIDKGENAGIKRDMAVMTADGIVGKVLLVLSVGVAGAVDQRSEQRRGRDPREDASARRSARHRQWRSRARTRDERRAGSGRRNRADQRRRPDFSQGPARRHRDEGRKRQRPVSEYQDQARRQPEQTGRSAGAGREAGTAGRCGRRRARARRRHSGAAAALGARQAGRRCEVQPRDAADGSCKPARREATTVKPDRRDFEPTAPQRKNPSGASTVPAAQSGSEPAKRRSQPGDISLLRSKASPPQRLRRLRAKASRTPNRTRRTTEPKTGRIQPYRAAAQSAAPGQREQPTIACPSLTHPGEQVEVYRFSIPVTIGVPLLALFVQAFVPLRFPRFAVYLDLPLLVTIFFAMARRSPIAGLFTGAVIGLAQDMLGHNPIGIYGIAKTVVGYGASSLGVKLDVENAGARFLVTLGFYLIHSAVYFTVARGLVNMTQTWSWPHGILAGLANAILGVALFFLLDKFKQRT